MKLVTKFERLTDADEAAMLLMSHGIVTHVSARGTKSLGYIIQNIADAGLWAILDHQYEDAVKVLDDHNHIVTTGLSEQELLEFEEHAEFNIFNSLNKALLYGVGLIIVMLLIANHFDVLK